MAGRQVKEDFPGLGGSRGAACRACTPGLRYALGMNHPGKVLVLADGGLAGLVAIAAAREAVSAYHAPVPAGQETPRPMVMFVPREASQTDLRSTAVRAQAQKYDVEVVAAPLGVGGLNIQSGDSGLADSISLSLAAGLATAAGYPEVVWPAHFGEPGEPDEVGLDAAARAVDRAALATRLAALDSEEHRVPSIRIKTPLADLSARQLAEVALDLNVPIELCWWWKAAELAGGMTSAATSVAMEQRHQWTALFTQLGWREHAAENDSVVESDAGPQVQTPQAGRSVAGMSVALGARRRQRG